MDELKELEIMELIDTRNILLNELEAGCSLAREEEILDLLNNIYEQLDLIY